MDATTDRTTLLTALHLPRRDALTSVCGVATKTSYSGRSEHSRPWHVSISTCSSNIACSNVKGEGLLHLDRPNAAFGQHPDAAAHWAALRLPADLLGPLIGVRVHAPQGRRVDGTITPTVHSRPGERTSSCTGDRRGA